MELDDIAYAYLRQRRLLSESFDKSVEDDITVATPKNFVPGEHTGTAIGSRDNLPYNPSKKMHEIRSSLADESKNPVLQAANRYTRQKFGTEIDTNPDSYVPSSLRKQYAIGKLGELAASHSPEYKSAVFNDYKSNHPELVKEAGAHDYDSFVAGAYKKAASETGEQFNHLPVRVQFHPGHLNYHDSNEMMRDIFLHKNLTTYQGGDRHEFLHEVHPTLGVTSNDILRAVHDGYSHGIMGSSFGPKGEEIAYQTHAQMYSPLARVAVAGETRQQNSLVNYTPRNIDILHDMEKIRGERIGHIANGDVKSANEASAKLRDVGSKWRYADQISVALPSAMVHPKYNGEVPHYVKSLLRDKQADVNPLYDVDKDHLGIVKLAKFYNTKSNHTASPSERGQFNAESATDDLHHMADIHGFTGVTRNPFKE